MKLTPTEALKRISVSADTLYKDMKRGKLSFEKKGSRKRLIDVSELERVYGPLKPEKQATSENVSSYIRPDKDHVSAESSGQTTEIAFLRQQVEMLSEERRRERDQMQEQIDRLEQTLKNAQEQQTRLTALLTDRRDDTARKEAQEQAQLIRELRIGQTKLRQELRAVREQKGFLARWLGVGAAKKAEPAKRPRHDTGAAGG